MNIMNNKIVRSCLIVFVTLFLCVGVSGINNQKENNKNTPLNLLVSTMLSRSLYVACDLNISDILKERGGLSIDQLSSVLGANPKALKKLIGFLIQQGFFKEEVGLIYNNEESETLCQGHDSGLRAFFLHDDKTRWNSYGQLGSSVLSGKPSFDELYGKSYFEYLKDKPELSLRFDQAMNVISESEEIMISKNFVLSGSVIDVGGGQGKLIKKVLSESPLITSAYLIDLPTVVSNVVVSDNRFSVVGGSFFEEIKLSADTFFLKRILHDWNDEQALVILKNIAESMGKTQNSKLVIFEGILNYSDKESALPAIDLALLTIFGGEERSAEDFDRLIKESGMKIDSIAPVTDTLSAISCSLMV
jgi:hypothetical protein